jgi:hypothetical protein
MRIILYVALKSACIASPKKNGERSKRDGSGPEPNEYMRKKLSSLAKDPFVRGDKKTS